MLRLPNIHVDRVSFWLGFLAASLFWWAFSYLRPLIPVFLARMRKTASSLNVRNLAGAEDHLRHEVLLHAQQSHLASHLFSLDEVLVSPRLIVPPFYPTPGTEAPSTSIAADTLPYLPEWPELTSAFAIPTISPLEALQYGSHLAIIGQPGAGKSVVLACLASQLARSEHIDGTEENLQSILPLYLHIDDLNLQQVTENDPFQPVLKAVTGQVNLMYQAQVRRFLQISVRDNQRKMVLLLDGLDELPQGELDNVSSYLRNLTEKMPRLQIVTTLSPDFTGDLFHMGFNPLSIACWRDEQVQEFFNRFANLWTQQLLPEIKRSFPTDEVDPLLIQSWLGADRTYETPLQLTLKIWAALAGDLNGLDFLQLVESYLLRFLPSETLLTDLSTAAHNCILQQRQWVDLDDIESILSARQPPADKAEDSSVPSHDETTGINQLQKKGKEMIVSQGEQIISALISGGILVQQQNRRLRFSSPIFTGYLASLQTTPEEAQSLLERLNWTTARQTLRFLAACTPSAPWITDLISSAEPPLFQNWFSAVRWLADTPPNSDLRIHLRDTFARQIQNDNLCLSVLARFAAAFVTSREAAAPRLFRGLLSSGSEKQRRIGALGAGALGSPSLLPDLLNLLIDPSLDVQNTACLAIGALPGDMPRNALIDILSHADENLRQIAAEVFVTHDDVGRDAVVKALTSSDLLTRRAAVLSLFQVRGEWARGFLDKIAIEDSQWVVRNAAAQGLEEIKKLPAPGLSPLPIESESPWLLAYAGKLGLGIRPGEPATDVLLNALKLGEADQQLASLSYLSREAVEGVVGVFYNILYSNQVHLHDPIFLALWQIAATGYKMPSPMKYGLG